MKEQVKEELGDGIHEYTGAIDDIPANVNNRNEFMYWASIEAIVKMFDLIHMDVDEEAGKFTLRLKDRKYMHWSTVKQGEDLICKNK